LGLSLLLVIVGLLGGAYWLGSWRSAETPPFRMVPAQDRSGPQAPAEQSRDEDVGKAQAKSEPIAEPRRLEPKPTRADPSAAPNSKQENSPPVDASSTKAPQKPAEPNAPSAAPDLLYDWKPGRTLSYKLSIDADLGNFTETHRGPISLGVQATEGGRTTLSAHESLFAERREKQPDALRRMIPRFSPSVLRPGLGLDLRFITVDAKGRRLQESGRGELPYLLGDASELVVDLLPGTKETSWEVSSSPTIEASSDRFPGLSQANEAKTRYPARQTIRYKLGPAVQGRWVLEKSIQLQTQEQAGDGPVLSLVMTGKSQFDPALGVFRQGELDGVMTARSETVVRRIPIHASFEYVDRADAPAGAPDSTPPPLLSPQVLAKLMEELGSTDPWKVRKAADQLARAKLDADRRPRIASALEGLLEDPDGFTRAAAVKALKVWRTPTSLPLLIRAVADESFVVRHTAMEILGEEKEARAVDAIVKQLPRDRRQAADALRQIGGPAESSVVKLLDNLDPFVRREACEILQQIGGKGSLDALTKSLEDPDVFVQAAARKAMEQIRRR
jgi:hypothetical protein